MRGLPPKPPPSKRQKREESEAKSGKEVLLASEHSTPGEWSPNASGPPPRSKSNQLTSTAKQTRLDPKNTRPAEPSGPPPKKKSRAGPPVPAKTSAVAAPATTAKAAPKATGPQHCIPRAMPANLRFESMGELPNYPACSVGPRPYGHWVESDHATPAKKPCALILFCGRSRPGDLQQYLAHMGWLVCALDTAIEPPTNILDEGERGPIIQDIMTGFYEAVWVATPSSTFSPLSSPPGPVPLRSLAHPMGLPGLGEDDAKRLKEANALITRTIESVDGQRADGKAWGVENPDHGSEKVDLWDMPQLRQLAHNSRNFVANFDQCAFGLGTKKPTRFMYHQIVFEGLDNIRCPHPPKQQKDHRGHTYMAPHPSVAQKKDGGEGESKKRGERAPHLSWVIAKGIHDGWRRKELSEEELP